jgi:hypothetical protein
VSGRFRHDSRHLAADATVRSVRLLLLTCSHSETTHGRNQWAEDLVSRGIAVGRIAIDLDQRGHPVSDGDRTSPQPDEGFSMSLMIGRPLLVLCSWIVLAGAGRGQDVVPNAGTACPRDAVEDFEQGVWDNIAVARCLQCHRPGGEAEESGLVLQDIRKLRGSDRDEAMRRNREAFARLAREEEGGQHRLLAKPTGRLGHGGGEVLKPGSKAYLILEAFVRRIDGRPAPTMPIADDRDRPPFFDGVVMLDARRLLRRVTLSLAGRLPTPSEAAAVVEGGLDRLPPLLDALMTEDAFYDRLREGFNDILLTLGIDGNAEATVLSYEHFEKTRLWDQTFDLGHVPEKDRQKARYKLSDDYRKALLGEPMKLIEHIVRNDRPFTEVVTADYIMVTPYSARGYGVFEEVRARFKNPDDPFEYVPVKLKALKGRSRQTDQESATGDYPHAGLLGSFQYLRRYPTTETNRNRLRARMFYLHFLGVDTLELAARVSDAASATARYPIPTRQAPECVVCHRTLDPVAGLFQDFYDFDGVYGRRKGGWYDDMFPAGFEGEALPAGERWRALQWLGERTAKDPRFAVAMVEHVYYLLTGRKVLPPPKDLDDPLHAARLRSYRVQRRTVEAIAGRFARSGFNLKGVFKDWIVSDFYRADGLATALDDLARRAELEDAGLVRVLSPEQLERKIEAVFGQRWGRLLDGELKILYGGIDSQEVTERAADPSGAIGAIQRILSNEIAARHTLSDFALEASRRRLFPGIEPDVLPGSSPGADAAIRRAIVHLHALILGRDEAEDSEDVARTFRLFADIVADATGRKGLDRREIYHARRERSDVPDDPHYTIRAWRAVVTYLLRRPEFLYE